MMSITLALRTQFNIDSYFFTYKKGRHYEYNEFIKLVIACIVIFSVKW